MFGRFLLAVSCGLLAGCDLFKTDTYEALAFPNENASPVASPYLIKELNSLEECEEISLKTYTIFCVKSE